MGVSVTACGPRRDDTQKKITCECLVNECIVGGDSLPRGLRWRKLSGDKEDVPTSGARTMVMGASWI